MGDENLSLKLAGAERRLEKLKAKHKEAFGNELDLSLRIRALEGKIAELRCEVVSEDGRKFIGKIFQVEDGTKQCFVRPLCPVGVSEINNRACLMNCAVVCITRGGGVMGVEATQANYEVKEFGVELNEPYVKKALGKILSGFLLKGDLK